MAHIFTPALRRPLSKPFAKSGTRTLIQRAIASLRARGTDAHLWLPGVGTVNGLTTGNYLESTGNSVAKVNNPVGLVLDALGSVGSELVTNGGFDSDTGWAKGAGWTIAGGVAVATSATGALDSSTLSVTPGKMYRLSYTITRSAGGIQSWAGGTMSADRTSSGTYTEHVVWGASAVLGFPVNSGFTGTIDNISVREVSGIHLTQSTTANKPIVQRGLWNLLTYSSDLSNAIWSAELGAAKISSTQFSLPADYSGKLKQYVIGVGIGTPLTAAFVISGTPGKLVYLVIQDEGGAYTAEGPQITLTETPTLYVANRSASATADSSIRVLAYGEACTVTIGGMGLFKGTLTASEILAAGGIPVTTTAAGSNPDSGRHAWRFDGSNDSLALGSVPFQMGDDHWVVAAVQIGDISSVGRPIFSEYNSAAWGATIELFEQSGLFRAKWVDDAASSQVILSGAYPIDTVAVVALRKFGNNKQLWVNGAQVGATNTVAMGAATITNADIGRWQWGAANFDYFKGNIYHFNAGKGTLTDSEFLLEQRLAANAAGITL